jgi:hypothetical protein
MIIKIKSENKNLLSILNKNPNTDDGLYLRPLRNGHIIGNCVDENTYEVIFHDTKHSYTRYEDNQIDFKSFCSPEVILNILRELFGHLIKDVNEVNLTPINWLDSTIGGIDNTSCNIEVENFLVASNWYRDGEFLLSRYLPNVKLTKNNDFGIFKLSIESENVVQAINTLGIVSFLGAVTNSKEFFIDESQVEKYANILSNVKTVPYFVYYLFIKRCCIRSNKVFDKIVPTLESKFFNNTGSYVSFTPNDTHKDRMIFVKDNLDMNLPVLNFGCGEFQHEKFLGKYFKSTMVSYDIEDFSELHEKYKSRFNFNWCFTNNLDTIDNSLKYQVILSEVFEHLHPEEAVNTVKDILNKFNVSKLIITTPNKTFNKYYNLEEGEFRRDDHLFELTKEEFLKICDSLNEEFTYYSIGDKVNGDCVTLGCVINYEK